MGDVRRAQQAGWVSRTFEGATTAVTIPHATSDAERVVEVMCPEIPTHPKAEKFMAALLGGMRCRWVLFDQEFEEAGDARGVYRVLVGKAALEGWVDLPLYVMRNRIAYHPTANRIVCVIEHPDSLLMAGEGKKVRVEAAHGALGDFGRVVRGEMGALGLMARDCVKCHEEHDGAREWRVTEIDRNGLGLCSRHSGFDVRPEGQRWQQESMF